MRKLSSPARGIAAGVHAVFPETEQLDDCFHVRHELNNVGPQLEQRAYGAIEREEEVEKALAKTCAKDQKRRLRQKRKMARARHECQQAMARLDAFEAASAQVREAMEYVALRAGPRRLDRDLDLLS
jgi:hypothetical protein